MRHAAPGTRTLRQATGALGAVALMALGAAPAVAADPAPTPHLVLGEMAPRVDGLKPGGTYDVPVSFTNTGTAALDKVYLQYSVTRGLSHTELPSNCIRYDVGSYDELPEKSYAICEFDQPVEPGVVYAPEKALTLNVLDYALHDELRVVVDADGSLPGDENGVPVPGTGPAVKLVEKPDATPAEPGSGEHEGWDDANVSVNAENTADLQLSAGKLSGKVGDTVSLEVKLTNAGPGWVLGELDNSVTKVRVTIPAGTTVTKAAPCTKVGAGVYECGTAQRWLKENAVERRTFKLRIDKAVTGAKASAKLTGQARPYDKNPENDSLEIPLDVTGGSSGNGGGSAGTDGGSSSSTGGDSGTSTSGGSGSDGGSTTSGGSSATGTSGSSTTANGDLASTGSGAALPLAGAAAAAVAVGAGAVLVVRRRRSAQQ
ncbi:hypothetical protein [Streptomyces justiciae]|uniref:hypothetical protein n=1 Tax=Streptomyces justiciae TaxID=2780140 RepID=UPI001881DB1D|nr:hypothetical protein [Streptomyces justiciae]MBE8474534.1 hypothetical protein [Streptomyces justiciae]